MRFLIPAALIAAAIPAPAMAQTPEALACMETGYSEQEQAVINEYIATFDLESMDGNDALAEALGLRASACAGAEIFDEDLAMAMIQYQFAGLSLRGIETVRPDVVAVIRRIDTDLPADHRARFYSIFETSVFGDPLTGEERAMTAEEDAFFSDTVLNPPVNGTIEQAEFIGAYLAGRIMRREAVKQVSAR